MVSNHKEFTDKSSISPGTFVTICPFSEVFDVKQKTAVHRLGVAKSKRKTIISGSMLCSSIPNRIRYTKTNNLVKISLQSYSTSYSSCAIPYCT